MKHPTVRTALAPPAWRIAGTLLIAIALAAPAAFAETGGANGSQSEPAGAPSTVPAVWVKKKIHFVYQGFTTHYSCDGLESAVKSVLLQLGARKSDLNVHETGCTRSLGRPEPFPGVAGSFYVLEPASKTEGAASSESGTQPGEQGSAASGTAQAHPVKAEWQTVKVMVGRPGLDQAGQCELIDQVKRQILPLFTSRDVKFQSSCFPHQLSIAGSTLQAQVLKAPGKGRELAQAPASGTAE